MNELITMNVERTCLTCIPKLDFLIDPLGLSLVVLGPWVICDEWNEFDGILKMLINFSITFY